MALRLEEATRMDWPTASAEAIRRAEAFNIEHIIKKWKEMIEQ